MSETLLLIRLLRERLGSQDLEELRHDQSPPDLENWDREFERLKAEARRLEEQVLRTRSLVARRYSTFHEWQTGQQQVTLRNSPKSLLITLIYNLIARSYEARFGDVQQSLQLARLAVEACDNLEAAGVSQELVDDLKAESYAYLGNALRINSDLSGAEIAFRRSQEHLSQGSKDRLLEADVLRLVGFLRFGQGQALPAAQILDRQVALRRVLGHHEALGTALIDRGTIAAWAEDLELARDLMVEGLQLIDEEDYDRMLQALLAIAERLSRDGDGFQAWQLVCSANVVARNVAAEGLLLQLRWNTGLALRAGGDASRAIEELEAVRLHLLENDGQTFQAGLVSLDLAAAYAADGRWTKVRELAEEAYVIFKAIGLEQRALAAFLQLREAALAEKASAELVVRVANFLARQQFDRELQFDPEAAG